MSAPQLPPPPDFELVDRLVQEYLVYRGFSEVRAGVRRGERPGVVHEPHASPQTLSTFIRDTAADRFSKYNVDAFMDQVRALVCR